ncbi:MAG: LysM peptidoglycan-binding domain-containing protein, partial [Parachlamydiaceae bacterium]
ALLNMGLLGLLFFTATRDVGGESLPTVENEPIQIAMNEEPAPMPLPQLDDPKKDDSSENDEIDQALKEFLPEEKQLEPAIAIDQTLNPPPAPQVSSQAPVLTEKKAEKKEKNPSNVVDVTVKRGDMLEKIAKANNTTVQAIKEANKLTSDNLKIGQVLKVPVDTLQKKNDKKFAQSPEKEDKTIASNSNEPVYYTVKSGDNPWKIAKQFKVNFEDILKLNNMSEEKAKNLKVGDKIRVK